MHFAGLGSPGNAAPASCAARPRRQRLPQRSLLRQPTRAADRIAASTQVGSSPKSCRCRPRASADATRRCRSTSASAMPPTSRSSSRTTPAAARAWTTSVTRTTGVARTHDASVKGIGYVTGRSADPQFVLQPGQTRNATFGLIRYEASRRSASPTTTTSSSTSSSCCPASRFAQRARTASASPISRPAVSGARQRRVPPTRRTDRRCRRERYREQGDRPLQQAEEEISGTPC